MEDSLSTPFAPTSFDADNSRIQASALAVTRKAAGLPGDISFHRSMDRDFAQELDLFSERILKMTNRLLSLASTVDTTQGRRDKGKGKLGNQDDITDNFHSLVVDSMDQLLERTDSCLDAFLGRNKAPVIAINPPITSKKKVSLPEKGRSEPVIQHAANLSKPQLQFTKMVDNSDTQWYPSLSHKYNAKVPLGHVYIDDSGNTSNANLITNHPYRYEITHLNYLSRIFIPCTPIQPTPLEETEATWVATKEEFERMVSKLKLATEIAVDLEHHSYRSYAGFLCLMQISDREQDWVVDLLTLRDEIEILNEIFTNPEIVKVFHGADSDIVWLQQDFNVYIVNLFDTFHASKLLEFPRHGLANLLEMYCDFVPDKRYQLADWRIRPLPKDMLNYARSDTHFLLYIYDNLRNALLDRSKSKSKIKSRSGSPLSPSSFVSTPSVPVSQALLHEALSRSAETSLRVYSKEPYDAAEGTGPGGWDTLAKKWNKIALTAGGSGVGIEALQREVYRSVHGWRERVAREEDESTRYVLQNHVLFLMAEQPPADMAALMALFKSSVPPVVKKRAKELLSIVKEAVKRGLAMSHLGGQRPEANIPEEQTGTGDPPAHGKVKKDVIMLETEIKSLEESNKDSHMSIWAQDQDAGQSRIPSTSTSSLFRSSESVNRLKTVGYATSVSMLFGTTTGSKFVGLSSTAKTLIAPHTLENPRSQRFEKLVAKINRSFSMAPAVPQIITTTPDAATEVESEIEKASGMQVEIPYVASAQRHTKQGKEDVDTIVVVGQARQKRKRKPVDAKGSTNIPGMELDIDNTATTTQAKQQLSSEQEKSETFDFSTAPNILDDNPDLEDRKKKRQKKQSKGGNFYGDFPAPPKAHSEVKKGNQSHTFK